MDPRLSRRAVLHGGALSALALLAAACGGGDGGSADTTAASTTEPETTEPPATTAPATTTTRPATTTTGETAAATTTTVPAGPVFPLTGLPVTDEAAHVRATRPALVAKVDNHPEARPQFGLNTADIVFEENVESLTRFAAVYHSQDVLRVGPVRSGRTQDVDLLGSLAEPLFVWSGGNGRVTAAINASDLVNLSPTTTRNAGFFRERRGNEDSEHTLYARPMELWLNHTRVYAPYPGPQFTFRPEGAAPTGDQVAGMDVDMDGGVDVGWRWDAATSTYLRTQAGRPHLDAEWGQVSANNVVVLEVDYRPSPADARSPEAQTVGTGVAHVLTGGVLITGTWTRDDRLKPFSLSDADGAAIAITPGRTWVELARQGTAVPVP